MTKLLQIFMVMMSLGSSVNADSILWQDHPAQFISYWKSDVITAEEDELVAFANGIFSRLLRAWDSSRYEPGLYVVDSDRGAWAVSLVDGNILLSRQAILACKQLGIQHAQHLLAFVLAHELAHQRSDDLWQHRFFRLNKNTSDNDLQGRDLNLQMDKRMLSAMQQKEARADHDGLILMASVGFNPYQIVDKKDFFTQWVENIWQQPCELQSDDAISEACQQARQRALRTRAQLDTVASQSSLYQLGVQAMVARQYEKARLYFTQYARDFPSRSVMTALGLSHLAQAIDIRKQLIQSGAIQAADFYFPLMLDASAGLDDLQNPIEGSKRSALDAVSLQQQKKQALHVEKAVPHFEKAIRLEPEHRTSYLLLANAYLLSDNSFMARGILQGRYIPKFGKDEASTLMLAITTSTEGDNGKAIQMLDRLLEKILQPNYSSTAGDDVLVYSVVYNLSELLRFEGQPGKAESQWKLFARFAKAEGKAYLFRLALGQIQSGANEPVAELDIAPSISGLRLGTRKSRDDSSHSINELWIEGDQFHVYNYDSGAQFITGSDGRIISARQLGGQVSLGALRTGDSAERTLKTLGLPDRRLQLVAGEYLAYDQYGLAIHIDENSIMGWFLY